jgi:succinate-semialdehyde dehydrogenase / glutarate-semialdehyde dehydrogenase
MPMDERGGAMTIATRNPTTGELLETFEEFSDDEVEARLERARLSTAAQRRASFKERAAWMYGVADLFDSERDAVATMLTTEMGKTIRAARAEVAKCATGCRYFADHAERMLADERADAELVGAVEAYATYQPLGVVLAVMPWNFPLWQVIRFAAPALMAGNVGLLKHASNVPRTALYLGDLFRRAGFDDGAFQTLLIGSSRVESVIRDPRVAAVTLTGSGPAGAAVARVAGEVIKPSVL